MAAPDQQEFGVAITHAGSESIDVGEDLIVGQFDPTRMCAQDLIERHRTLTEIDAVGSGHDGLEVQSTGLLSVAITPG